MPHARLARDTNRRGALLLLVLGMLALFLMVGMLMLVNATRARTAARAFAAATATSLGNDASAAKQLNEALMVLLRGSRSALPPQITESLLEDKYGNNTVTGTIVLASPASSGTAPILAGTITALTSGTAIPAAPTTPGSRLNGRILTLVPPAGGGDTVSFRILGASGTSVPMTLYLANVPGRPGLSLPTGTCSIRINGREFTPPWGATSQPPESYDSYGDENAWLAQPTMAGGTLSFNRLTFLTGTTGPAAVAAAQVDNDGDGTLDGSWISGTTGFLQSPSGSARTYRVSYLVLDLDGRLNINATGMANQPAGAYTGTSASTSAPAQVPLGMGYGPADLDASSVVSGSLPSPDGLPAFMTGTSRVWSQLLRGGTSTIDGGLPVASDSQRRPAPRIGVMAGRYGPGGVPGSAGDDTLGNQPTSYARYGYLVGGTSWFGATPVAPNAITSNALPIGGAVGNSVTDLKAQLKVFVTSSGSAQITPSLNFFAADPSSVDFLDDPYESRFDTAAPRHSAPRNGSTPRNDDSPFTLGELERVLRPFDGDATTLPPRLAALLDDRAQALRMAITTDGWDAPVLTGSAARMLEDRIAQIVNSSTAALAYPWATTNVPSPDIAAGLKFDVNRLVANPSQAQDYCRGLYTLAILLGATNTRQAAQWAVNVLDFRDEDSRMTRFVYDTDLSDGWQGSGAATTGTVFGVERPEFLITETAGWMKTTGSGTGQLFVNLHRPAWNAIVTGTMGPIAARETLATELRGAGGNLNLGAGAGTNRVWQLRFDQNKVLQFRPDLTTTGTVDTAVTQQRLAAGTVTATTSIVLGSAVPSGVLTIAPGDYICIQPGATPENFTVAGSLPRHAVTSGTEQFRRTTSGTVYLERLADPTQAPGPENPYVVVDSAPINVIDITPWTVTPPPPETFKKRRRRGPKDGITVGSPLAIFWNSDATTGWVDDGSTLDRYPLGTIGTGTVTDPAPWLHWPNRPFVSHAELALVPSDDAEGFLSKYSFPTSSLASGTMIVSGSIPIGQLILDAVHVPSRFAENTISITGSTASGTISDDVGVFRRFDQPAAGIGLPTWREPGRINVNTIVSGTDPTVTPESLKDALVWATVIGGTTSTLSGTTLAIHPNPFTPSGTSTPTPARSIAHVLSLTGSAGGPIASETFSSGTSLHPRAKNPFFSYARAIRLANTATVRSNVFAVWITLEIRDDSPSNPSTTYRRLFAIIDRSIPVGFSPGEDLNVRDTIRVLRYLD